ncbi:CHASE3 domain-containing protein [Oscillatoria sp. FACHB-1407]|uniref:sensor histidine kinase n=1 Tax=Oscillatoria sp. FACHB-1407 TaxID=2692847 RepID=UPI0016841E7B|nr:ATP-binding protein [Oscillatoria sp. FACHB-1407]MBD2465673.1 CHASE3 domain-containing protein [Oscillatoria sp. FACHB-1407]
MVANKKPPQHSEEQRLQVLHEHHILDTASEPIFDRFVRAAQEVCQTPVALISLVDEKRLWFKAKIGMDASDVPRDGSFCARAIEQPDILIVPNAQQDERFAQNPFVNCDPGIRFYAGVPLKSHEGYALGTLCVVDYKPRHLTASQIHALRDLSRRVSVELQRRRAIAQLIHKPTNGYKAEKHFLRQLTVRFGLMIAITLGTQLGSHISNTRVLEGEDWVSHTLEAISDIETVNAELANLQATTQQYVILGDPQTLATYDQRVNAIQLNLRELRQLTRDNAYQQQNLDQLQPVLDQELAYLEQIITTRETGGLPSVTSLMNKEDQRVLNSAIRNYLMQMRQEEERLLTQRLARVESKQETAALVSGIGRLVVLGIIFTTFLMIRQEIKRRNLAEENTEEQRELLEITLSSIGDAVVVTDCDRHVTSLNPIAEALTGWTEEEARHHSIDEVLKLVNLETGESVESPFQTTLATANIQTLATGVGLQHRDGTIIPIDDSCAPIFNKQGVLRGAVMVFRDATLRVQAEAEIQHVLQKEKELSELKSNFISMVSHDIRTPLTIILTSIELLQNYIHKTTEEQRERYFQRIRAAIKRIQEFLSDVLLVSKADSGALKYEPAPLDLSEFCSDLTEEVQLSTGNSHQIVFSNQCAYQTVQADPKLLHHILINLLSNAVKYSPEKGKVYFDLECTEQQIQFRIRDEGIGIPEEDLPQLFSVFHRASNVGQIAGTGLGLSIVKNCVELHSGEIAVSSKVNQGTTFTVTLPI